MAPSAVESVVNSFMHSQHSSKWQQVIEGRKALVERTADGGSGDSMSKAGKITAIVIPIVLLALGIIISLAIYAHRRRSRAEKKVPQYRSEPVTPLEKSNFELSAPPPNSNGTTFIVPLPTLDQIKTGQDARIRIVSEKPQVLYVAPGEDPSSSPLKKDSEIPHYTPALKINTSALAPPLHGQTSSPLSPRTTASKSPGRYSMTSTKTEFSGKAYRVVVADSTFPTTLADELELRVGECLYLIEEYEDEWCLVQRVGSKEKGVVPRLCVTEKEKTPSAKIRNVFRFSAQAIAASQTFKV